MVKQAKREFCSHALGDIVVELKENGYVVGASRVETVGVVEDVPAVEVKSCSQLSLSYMCLIMFLLLRPWAAQVTVQVPRQLAV